MLSTLSIGFSLGCVYALVGLGFSLIYRTTGVISFAQGAFVMFGGMVTAWGVGTLHLNLVLAGVLGVTISSLAGLVLALGIILPLWWRKASAFALILGTTVFLLAAQNVILKVYGSEPRAVPPVVNGTLGIAGQRVPWQTLVVALAAVLLSFGLAVFLRRSRIGLAMRAVAESREVAQILGIRTDVIAVVVFVLAAALGAVAGLLIAPLQFASYSVGLTYNIRGFAAALIGGLGDIRGAFVGGIFLGVTEALVGFYLSTKFLDVFVFGLVLLLLVVRPQGLLGTGPRLPAWLKGRKSPDVVPQS